MKSTKVFLALLVVGLGFNLGKVPIAYAAQHQWGASYFDWEGAELSKNSSVSQIIEPLEISPKMYWESGWHWNNAPDGGYGGIQSKGILASGEISDLAIFSIWNAKSAIPGTDAGCTPFGGEGIGYSCRVPINLSAGKKYKMTFGMEILESKQFWKATVTDLTLQQTKVLGWIEAPAQDLKALNWNNFIEYWGEAVSCNSVGLASAKFFVPISTKSEIEFHSPKFSRPQQPCVNSSGETPPIGYVGEAIMRFGGPTQFSSITNLPGTKNKELAAGELKAKQEAEAKAAAELKAKQEAEAKAAAELKAKQEAEAKAAVELKAKQEAEAAAKAVAAKKITITCVKGKIIKKVTATKPKCPKGFKKK